MHHAARGACVPIGDVMKFIHSIRKFRPHATRCAVALTAGLAMMPLVLAPLAQANVFTWGEATMPNPQDWDGDGILNAVDTDNDNDGTPDTTDGAPHNPHSVTVAGVTDNSSSKSVDLARLHGNAVCYNSYSDWDNGTWGQLKDDLGTGIATFRSNGETVAYSSGTCPTCEGRADITAKLDLENQEYWFEGAMEFARPGYDNVSASISTDKIPFNNIQFSGGSLYFKTIYQNNIQTIRNYDFARTQTNPDNASDTLAATLDLDFHYDACLSDPDDLKTTKLGVKGRVMIQYEVAGESGFTHLWSTTDALKPVN